MRREWILTAGLAWALATATGCGSAGNGDEDEVGGGEAVPPAAEAGAAAESVGPGSAGTPSETPGAAGSREADLNDPELTTMPSGLKYKDLAPGTGEEARAGSVAVVHYTGWLVDGTKFDSSLDRGEPFEFPVGGGRVIKGWDQGVAGMKVGGKRRLVIPPDLGYGARGAGAVIPPDATLIFEVELLEVKPG